MEEAFYASRLTARGLTRSPDADDRAVLGTVSESSRAAYVEIIGRLAERGAQGLIFGCTEIELLSVVRTANHDEAACRGCMMKFALS